MAGYLRQHQQSDTCRSAACHSDGALSQAILIAVIPRLPKTTSLFFQRKH